MDPTDPLKGSVDKSRENLTSFIFGQTYFLILCRLERAAKKAFSEWCYVSHRFIHTSLRNYTYYFSNNVETAAPGYCLDRQHTS